MTQRYDAIVIGAGLGGMAAATTLAHSGLSVLLLERHNVPGGYATSFVRSRAGGGQYEFEVALHELSGIGPPESRGALTRAQDDAKFALNRAARSGEQDGIDAAASLAYGWSSPPADDRAALDRLRRLHAERS